MIDILMTGVFDCETDVVCRGKLDARSDVSGLLRCDGILGPVALCARDVLSGEVTAGLVREERIHDSCRGIIAVTEVREPKYRGERIIQLTKDQAKSPALATLHTQSRHRMDRDTAARSG